MNFDDQDEIDIETDLNSQKMLEKLFIDIFKRLTKKYLDRVHLFNLSINGNIGSNRISINVNEHSKNKSIDIAIHYRLPVDISFYISKETAVTSAKKILGIEDINTGHKKFDKVIYITSKEPASAFNKYIAAFLNIKIRNQLLLWANENEFEITDRTVTLSLLLNSVKSYRPDTIVSYLKTLVITAEFLIYACNYTRKSLVKNIIDDPVEEVQINNIHQLVKNYPPGTRMIQQLSRTYKKCSVPVQIVAAAHAGKSGLKHMVKLLKENSLLKKEQIKIIHYLIENEYRKSIPVLQELLLKSDDIILKKKILIGFRKFNYKRTVTILTESLRNAEPELIIEIIKTLGYCGTVESIEVLAQFLDNKGYSLSVKTASKKAISHIQSRFNIPGEGMLSISDGSEKEGLLSISKKADKGSLSVDK